MQFRLIRMSVLWVITGIVFCLHETFDVANIIYGIDVRSADANGTVPAIQHALRLTFDVGSMLIAIVILYTQARWLRWALLIFVGLTIPANILHVIAIYKEDPGHYSQIGLLIFVLFVSIALFIDNYKWVKGT